MSLVPNNADDELARGVELATGIYLTPLGARIIGDPTLEDFCDSVDRCQRLANASMWCLGDLLYYGERHATWGETYTQAISLTGKSAEVLTQAVRLSKAYPQEDRVPEGSWSHHRVMLAVKDPAERTRLLQRAAVEHQSVHDVRAMLSDPKPPTRHTCPNCGHEY